MIKCQICGIEKATAREMHGHLVRVHYDEYKAKHNDMEKLTSGYVRNKKQRVRNEKMIDENEKKELKNERPNGLRLLNKKNETELAAYNEGYRYTDGDLCYTSAEVKEEGWL